MPRAPLLAFSFFLSVWAFWATELIWLQQDIFAEWHACDQCDLTIVVSSLFWLENHVMQSWTKLLRMSHFKVMPENGGLGIAGETFGFSSAFIAGFG